jgi:hypothetical protein
MCTKALTRRPRAARRRRWVTLATLPAALAIAALTVLAADPAAVALANASKPSGESGGKPSGESGGRTGTAPGAAKAWTFPSDPALDAPRISIAVNRAAGGSTRASGPGSEAGHAREYIFLAPHMDFSRPGSFIGRPGPEILEPNGNLVWQDPLRGQLRLRGKVGQLSANDFHVATYQGKPVLVWWQGFLTPEATGSGSWVIANEHYQRIATVRAPKGYSTDLHAFQITPQGTAYLIAGRTVSVNLRGCCNGPVHGRIYDQVVFEIDIRTGKVLWRWDALQHIPLRDSYEAIPAGRPWEPYHLNSIDFSPSGNLIVSARNTWAAYWIDRQARHRDGDVFATLGGKASSFKLGPGARFAWQHDVRQRARGLVTLFDDEAAPAEGRQSRGLILRLDWARHTAKVVRQYLLPRPQLAGSQGNVEIEPDGNVFVGWGQLPYFSEYEPSGKLLYEGVLPGPDGSYRAFRQPWVGSPTDRPRAVAKPAAHGASAEVYVSWNGATQVASWQLLAGSRPGALSPSGAPVARQGFETAIATASAGPYYAVEALDDAGHVLGSSAPTAR